MYCQFINSYISCNGICTGCSYNPYSNPNGGSFNPPSQFNYECPECHGKFNSATYRWISTEIKEIGSDTVIGNKGQGYYAFICPFCGRIMKGL